MKKATGFRGLYANKRVIKNTPPPFDTQIKFWTKPARDTKIKLWNYNKVIIIMSQALQHILLHTGKKYLCSGIFVVGTAASVYPKQNADTFF